MRQEGMRFKLAVASGSASFPFSFLMSSRVHGLCVKWLRQSSRYLIISSPWGASLPQLHVYSLFQFRVSLCSFFFNLSYKKRGGACRVTIKCNELTTELQTHKCLRV